MTRFLLLPLLLLATSTIAAEPARPLIVELFTSQGCNSCPPADALLRELAKNRPDVLPLAFHVTYWNNLGWRDPFSLDAATARQTSYNRSSGYGGNYTPQMVIEGHIDAVGSDRRAITAALKTPPQTAPLQIQLARTNTTVTIDIPAGTGNGRILLVGYDPEHQTAIPRGENAGKTLVEANIVRDFLPIGTWTGTAVHLTHALPTGDRIAVLVQAADGRYLGAVRE